MSQDVEIMPVKEGGAEGRAKEAFGYLPMRWPMPKMFSEAASDSQSKMAVGKARERMLPVKNLDSIRRLVLERYGVEDDGSKAAFSLFIDWLLNADESSLTQACAATKGAPERPSKGR